MGFIKVGRERYRAAKEEKKGIKWEREREREKERKKSQLYPAVGLHTT